MFMYLFYECMCAPVQWPKCGGQRTTFRSQVFPFTMQVPGNQIQVLSLGSKHT